MVNSLKDSPVIKLETCCVSFSYKVDNVAKLERKAQHYLTPRELRATLPKVRVMIAPDNIDLLVHKKEDGVIFSPKGACNTLSY